MFAHAWKLAVCPAPAGAGRESARQPHRWYCWSDPSLEPDFQGRSADPCALFGDLLGNHLVQSLDISAGTTPDRPIPRSVPTQQQVLRSSGGVPITLRQPASRTVSVG